MPPQGETVEERLARLEQLLDRVIEVGRQSPVGRKILAMVGLR